MPTDIKQIRYWDCFLSFNVLFFISFLCYTCFYITELLLWRKSTFENPFAQSFQISNLCICTGPHESLFYFSCLLILLLLLLLFPSVNFASFDKEILCGTSLLFCTEYVRNLHLLCSSWVDMLKKWNLHQTSDHETETNLSSLTVDHCRVDDNVSATLWMWSCQSINAFKKEKKKTPLDKFFMFYCKLLFIFVVEKKIVFTCGF